MSWGSPVAAVCARGDLESVDAVPSGCFDTKVTSYDMALRMQVDAVAGPTTEVRIQYCPTKKTADCAWFNGPASQLQKDLCMPHGLRLWVATHTYIYIHATALLHTTPLCNCLAASAVGRRGSAWLIAGTASLRRPWQAFQRD